MFLEVEVMLQGDGGNEKIVKVVKNLRYKDRKSSETYHNNQLRHTELYEVK